MKKIIVLLLIATSTSVFAQAPGSEIRQDDAIKYTLDQSNFSTEKLKVEEISSKKYSVTGNLIQGKEYRKILCPLNFTITVGVSITSTCGILNMSNYLTIEDGTYHLMTTLTDDHSTVLARVSTPVDPYTIAEQQAKAKSTRTSYSQDETRPRGSYKEFGDF